MTNVTVINSHLQEIKIRSIYTILSWVLCLCCCYSKHTQILYTIVKPVYVVYNQYTHALLSGDESTSILYSHLDFICTNVTEAFYATLQGCFFLSIVFTLPLLWYQFWCFFIPSCYQRERGRYRMRMFLLCVYMSVSMFIILYYILPYMLIFLYQFSDNTGRLRITNQPRISKHLSWILYTLCVSCVLFFLPVLMYIFLHKGLIQAHTLWKNRKIAILCMLVMAALAAPPDLLSQLLICVNLFVLYEFVLWIYMYNTCFFEHTDLTKI